MGIGNNYLVYLDAWECHINHLQDANADNPGIREVALGGPDTADRHLLLGPDDQLRVAAQDLDGLIVVDTPHFEEAYHFNANAHHVKPNEHLWYADPEAWERLFNQADLVLLGSHHPIEGKVVFYLSPNPETVLDVIVRGPTGLGDIHWILLKLPALKAAESPCRLTLVIPGNGDPDLIFRAKGFLDLLPFVDHSKIEIDNELCDWLGGGVNLERSPRIDR